MFWGLCDSSEVLYRVEVFTGAFLTFLNPHKRATASSAARPPSDKCEASPKDSTFLFVISTGRAGEARQPCESRGSQAEGQVSRPGPEARGLRLPDEEVTERGG